MKENSENLGNAVNCMTVTLMSVLSMFSISFFGSWGMIFIIITIGMVMIGRKD